MELIPVSVKKSSVYKSEVHPQSFNWAGIEFEILEILDRWYESYKHGDTSGIDYFKVKTHLVGTYIIRHDLLNNSWFLVM